MRAGIIMALGGTWFSLTGVVTLQQIYILVCLSYTCTAKKVIPTWNDEFLYLFHPISFFQYFFPHFQFTFFPFVLHYSPPLPQRCTQQYLQWIDSSHSNLSTPEKLYHATYSLIYTHARCFPFSLPFLANSVRRLGQFVCNTQAHTDVCIH